MHFHTEDLIEHVDCAAFEKLFFAEKLNIAICQALKMHRTLIGRDEHDGVLKRQVAIRPERDLPAPIRKVLGDHSIEYTETMTHTLGSMRGDWVIVPAIFTDKVSAHGNVTFTAHPQGVVRAVEGDVTVKIFGLSGLIERFIIADIRRSFSRAAQLTNDYLRQQQAGGSSGRPLDYGEGRLG